jgi:hypothetical protein
MKEFFWKKILQPYLIVGTVFQIPLTFSYIYSMWYLCWEMGWHCVVSEGPFVRLLGIMIVSALLRTILWLPSLISWAFLAPPNYNFFVWLMPGLYMNAQP